MVNKSNVGSHTQSHSSVETSELEAKISERDEEILALRARVHELRDELHTLKHARVLGRIIKARDYVGAARKISIHLPRGVIHQVRVIGAPLVPSKARKLLKRAYRNVKERATTRLISYELVANEPWSKGAPLVSVVIPYYNRADTIDETIDSLKSQTFRAFEVILVNDGSTDKASVQKLKHLKTDGLKIAIVHQDNQGVATARNTGVDKARGKYIVCLDSDDLLEETYVEKAGTLLETHPDIALATAYMQMFGVKKELFKQIPYDAKLLIKNNMVITAAMFRKEAWTKSGGYKSGIGYEDWEFWLNLSEHGFWGRQIPEALFQYRAALQSRYVDDKDLHWGVLKAIRALHPSYAKRVSKLLAERQSVCHVATPDTALINLGSDSAFKAPASGKPHVLIAIPWMTFGGAETLVVNFCKEVGDSYDLTFMTGLASDHQWEYKFKKITPRVYHLAELLEDPELYLGFVSNYITTRRVDVVHMVHTNFMFGMLETLRQRHPHVKFVVTMFNDRVPEYFGPSVSLHPYLDAYTTDNIATATHYQKELPAEVVVKVIPNGVDCYDIFNPTLFNRDQQRKTLGVGANELAVFFVGRLSPEKNPDVFLDAAARATAKGQKQNLKFFVIGDGPMKPEIEKTIANLRTTDVTYLGYHDTSEIAQYLSAADIFVLPSSIEGFPLSILEAMAMKVTVIASDVGAVSDVVKTGKNGFVVPAGSAKHIAERIMELNSDRKLLAAMKHKARQEVEAKYSNKALGENYKKMYRELL